MQKRLDMPELGDCVRREWGMTDCFFGGSFGEPWDARTRLDRAYLQVDREKLKALLQRKLEDSGRCDVVTAKLQARLVAPNIFEGGLAHDNTGSTLTLSTGDVVRAKVGLDSTPRGVGIIQLGWVTAVKDGDSKLRVLDSAQDGSLLGQATRRSSVSAQWLSCIRS